MNTRTIEIAVGTFILIGVLSLLMLALQVSGLGNFYRESTGYRVDVDFTNIGSLKPKARVSIGGVVVGRVVQLGLNPRTYNPVVVLKIDSNLAPKLPIDTRASIMTAGLIGDNYIALTPGFNETEFLVDNSIIPVENTDPAIILEQLVSKFFASAASKLNSSEAKTKKGGN